MPILTVDVLGPLDIHLSDDVALVFESNKAKALLTFLAVESGKAHSREAVANMFWPNRPDTASLGNLRHTLASLRKTLCEKQLTPTIQSHSFFQVSSSTIRFNRSNASVDLHKFEQLLSHAEQERSEDLQEQIDQLRAVVQLSRGRFLEGFSIRGSPEFSEWVLLQRETTDLKLRTALHNLVNALLSNDQWEQALSSLYHLLQLDPWDESAHRKVMALLASHHQRNAALSQYERCRSLLKDELGVEPDQETVQLYEQIRSGMLLERRDKGKDPFHLNPKSTPLPVKNYSHGQFVGREAEMAWLSASLDQALRENGRLALITGEIGSGKTRLAWEFCNKAMRQNGDLLVAAGRCNVFTGFEDPFLPFREVIQMLLSGRPMQPGLAISPEHLGRLTEAFPAILHALMATATDLIDTFISKDALIQRIESFGPPGHAWMRKFEQGLLSSSKGPNAAGGPKSILQRVPNEAITNMLIELSRQRPLLLFLDDMQWVDDNSINLLHYISNRIDSNRILILGSYRHADVLLRHRGSDQGREAHPLQLLQLELTRKYGEMELNLDHSDGAAFIDALIDKQANCLGKSFRKLLLNLTNGNPLFTFELLHSMEKQGHLQQDGQGLWVEAKPFNWQILPARVEAVIAERISRIPQEQQAVLRAASVGGETFSSEVVARVLNIDLDQVSRWLSGTLCREHEIVSAISLTRTGALRPGFRATDSRYRFNHLVFQKYLYNQLDQVERVALHEATGAALEELYGASTSGNALQLAWHFEEAGLLFRAAQYLLLAGKQAVTLMAYNQAEALYDRCLNLIDQIPESPERNQLEVQVQLAKGAPLLVTNGWGSQQAMDAINRAIELMVESSASASESSALLSLFYQADYFNAQSNIVEALVWLERLLDRAKLSQERIYHVMANTMAGEVYLFSGQPARAIEYIEEAISEYQPEDHDLLIEISGHNIWNRCRICYGWAHWLLGNGQQVEIVREQLINEARRQSKNSELSLILVYVGALLSALQLEPEQAEAYAQASISASKDGHVMVRTMGETVLGWTQICKGEWEQGIALVENGIAGWRASGALSTLPMGQILLADSLSRIGRTQESLDILDSLKDMIAKTGQKTFAAIIFWLEGEILARELQRNEQRLDSQRTPGHSFLQAIEIARQQQAREIELRASVSLAHYYRNQGQAGEAAAQLEAVLSSFDPGMNTRLLQAAKQLLTGLASNPSLNETPGSA